MIIKNKKVYVSLTMVKREMHSSGFFPRE